MSDKQVYRFRVIDGFPEYLVTDCGKVWSKLTEKFLKPRLVNGYHLVTLGGKNGKQVSIHVLVASSFICSKPENHVVNHKNGVRTDNHVYNLEWVTQSENVKHSYRNGLRTIDDQHRERASALGISRRSFTDKQASDVRASYNGKRGNITELSIRYGLSRYAISNILGAMK